MTNNEIKKLLEDFKEKMTQELRDVDFSTIYNDYDILGSIKGYNALTDLADKDEAIKTKLERAEKAVLRTFGGIKITNEEGVSFYVKRGEPYDNEGNLIEDMYEDYLDNDDLFCDYVGDDIYIQMKKNLMSKLRNSERDEF